MYQGLKMLFLYTLYFYAAVGPEWIYGEAMPDVQKEEDESRLPM